MTTLTENGISSTSLLMEKLLCSYVIGKQEPGLNFHNSFNICSNKIIPKNFIVVTISTGFIIISVINTFLFVVKT